MQEIKIEERRPKMILLTTAMDKEYILIKKNLSGQEENGCVRGFLGSREILLTKTGIGKVNAAYACLSCLKDHDDIEQVVAIGCAGAAREELRIGQVVVGTHYCYFDAYCGEPYAYGQIQGSPILFPANLHGLSGLDKCYLGTIASGDWFVNTEEKLLSIMNYLPTSYNVCAIDMESTALAQVCAKRNIGFSSVRIISDNPLKPNQAQQYESFWDDLAEEAFDVVSKILK